jgi:DNA polymerase epsilon subunit 2
LEFYANIHNRSKSKPSLFPPPSHKTELFHQRFNIVHQRILRNESFQKNPMAGSSRAGHPSDGSANNKITPISNLLGRTNSSHLLFGLLTVLPTGTLALADLTGSIPLDIQHARPFPDPSSVWFCPGMLFLIDGMYIEDGTGASESNLGTTGGIGGTIGGRFLASVIAHPPCERRSETLGIQDALDTTPTGPAFGWTDFLGVGSERATGSRMRKLESRILGPGAPHQANTKIAIAAEVNLDNPSTLTAIRSLFSSYAARPAAETPLAIVLMGNFISHAALTGAPGAGSIEYKEYFNGLAAVLSDFPTVLANTTLVFVPGDQDAWPSSFSAGAAVPIPRKAVPEMFTSRVRRVVAEANREVRGRGKGGKEGEVVWASNPARMSWFGCAGEMVMFRDDISGRLRRTAVRFAKSAAEDEDAEGAAERGAAASIEVEDQDMDGDDADTQPMDVDGPARDLDDDDVDPDILAARRLTKTLLDQAHLSPFPISTRPVHWDYASALQLYPLPSALVIADPEAPLFALNYMGCCVMNPGRLIDGRKGARARWIEFDVMAKKGEVVVEGA